MVHTDESKIRLARRTQQGKPQQKRMYKDVLLMGWMTIKLRNQQMTKRRNQTKRRW